VTEDYCPTCRRPRFACVCDRVVTYATERRVLVLQHPQEQDALLGSAQIVLASLPKTRLAIGLSWRNLAHALGEAEVDARRWALVFPDREAEGPGVTSRGAAGIDPSTLEGIIVLDGTWSKAKTLYWRNPWLGKLNRMTLAPDQPSIYGRLRAEPRREYVSTLESVAAALTLCGEPKDIEVGLCRVFRTLVQRVRDADVADEARRLPRRTRAPRVRKTPAGER
jgi:DTW domain-containing protein YfiP